MSCMRESGVPADGAAPKNSPADVAGALTYAKTTLEREREREREPLSCKMEFSNQIGVFKGGGRAVKYCTQSLSLYIYI